jgi:hypothetical protein
MYHAWNQEAYVALAECWLREPKLAEQVGHQSQPLIELISNVAQYPIQWNEEYKDEQLSLVAIAMSYIHTSASDAIQRLFSHQNINAAFFTPSTFREFTHLLRLVACSITENENVGVLILKILANICFY